MSATWYGFYSAPLFAYTGRGCVVYHRVNKGQTSYTTPSLKYANGMKRIFILTR